MVSLRSIMVTVAPQIARFMRPIWGPSGADRTQVGPILAPWTLLSGTIWLTWLVGHQRDRFMVQKGCIQNLAVSCKYITNDNKYRSRCQFVLHIKRVLINVDFVIGIYNQYIVNSKSASRIPSLWPSMCWLVTIVNGMASGKLIDPDCNI